MKVYVVFRRDHWGSYRVHNLYITEENAQRVVEDLTNEGTDAYYSEQEAL